MYGSITFDFIKGLVGERRCGLGRFWILTTSLCDYEKIKYLKASGMLKISIISALPRIYIVLVSINIFQIALYANIVLKTYRLAPNNLIHVALICNIYLSFSIAIT